MKKRFCLLLALGIIFSTAITASAFNWKFNENNTSPKLALFPNSQAAEFEILPTMDFNSNAVNQVWVGTFQLIWNDLIDEIIKKPVEFVDEKSLMAELLNQKDFTVNDLQESSYYKKLALASPAVKEEIESAIKEKFNETSDILDRFNWIPEDRKYILYAMLKKDFEYLEPFDKLPEGKFKGSRGMVKYFGVTPESSSKLRRTVGVLFYNGANDYAVTLHSISGDIVYLYRTNDDKNLKLLYADMIRKSKQYDGDRSFSYLDELKVPEIEFKSERDFPELANKRIKDTDFYISKAIETVQFKMDETGVKLKSEAGMMLETCALMPEPEKPRYFYFDDKYVVFLQDKSKIKPYFAMSVKDVEKLQK